MTVSCQVLLSTAPFQMLARRNRLVPWSHVYGWQVTDAFNWPWTEVVTCWVAVSHFPTENDYTMQSERCENMTRGMFVTHQRLVTDHPVTTCYMIMCNPTYGKQAELLECGKIFLQHNASRSVKLPASLGFLSVGTPCLFPGLIAK